MLSALTVAADLQYPASRLVLSVERLAPVLIPNLTVTIPVNRLEISPSVYNASSSAYADPTAPRKQLRSARFRGRAPGARLLAVVECLERGALICHGVMALSSQLRSGRPRFTITLSAAAEDISQLHEPSWSGLARQDRTILQR